MKGKLISLAAIILFLILLIFLLGFFNNSQLYQKKIIYIGAPLALTGSAASLGGDVKNAISLAVNEVNAMGKPYTLEVLYEDTKSDPTEAVLSVQKLIEVNAVKLLIGPVRSVEVQAVSPVTEKNKVILFTPVATAEEITDNTKYVFRNIETASLNGKEMAKYLRSKNTSSAYVLVAQSSNSKSFANGFENEFVALCGKISYFAEYPEANNDFKANIIQIIDTNCQAIYVAATTGRDAAIIVKQLNELGYLGKISGSTLFTVDEFLKAINEGARGVLTTAADLNYSQHNVKQYLKKYKSIYDKESPFYANNGYDAVYLLSEAIDSCSDLNTDCIAKFLHEVKNYPGAGGVTTFDSRGDVIKPLKVEIYSNGLFERAN